MDRVGICVAEALEDWRSKVLRTSARLVPVCYTESSKDFSSSDVNRTLTWWGRFGLVFTASIRGGLQYFPKLRYLLLKLQDFSIILGDHFGEVAIIWIPVTFVAVSNIGVETWGIHWRRKKRGGLWCLLWPGLKWTEPRATVCDAYSAESLWCLLVRDLKQQQPCNSSARLFYSSRSLLQSVCMSNLSPLIFSLGLF